MKIINEILSDLRAMDRSPAVMRTFGWVTALILFTVGGIAAVAHRNDPVMLTTGIKIVLALGLVLLVLAFAAPKLLKPINTVMMIVAMIIGWCVTRVVLIVMFYGVFFPVGLCLKLSGRDSMRRRLDAAAQSYWIPRDDKPFDPAQCRRLF